MYLDKLTLVENKFSNPYNIELDFKRSTDDVIANWINITSEMKITYDVIYHKSIDAKTIAKLKKDNIKYVGIRPSIDFSNSYQYYIDAINNDFIVNFSPETKFIVLLYKPEAFLHPKQQRLLPYELRKAFPNIQFICVTNSPFITQGSGDKSITCLIKQELDHNNIIDYKVEYFEHLSYRSVVESLFDGFEFEANDLYSIDENTLHSAVIEAGYGITQEQKDELDMKFIYDELQILEDMLANAGKMDRNHRIYPKEVLEKAIEEYKNKNNKMITYVSELKSDNFSERIKGNKIVLVDVMAAWCGPCKMLSPIIDEVGAHFGESVLVGKLDADTNGDLVKELGVRSIPAVLIYKDGEIVDRFTGFKLKGEIISLVESHMSN